MILEENINILYKIDYHTVTIHGADGCRMGLRECISLGAGNLKISTFSCNSLIVLGDIGR